METEDLKVEDFGLKEMLVMQRDLQEKYRDKWGGLFPEKGRDQLLWMIAETGEAAQVIKKNGDGKIMDNTEVRTHFVEEMCDVLMYFNDVLLCYGITPEELKRVYQEKHHTNMNRW